MGHMPDVVCGYGTSFQAKKWRSLDVCGLLGVTLSWSVHFFALFVIATKLMRNSLVTEIIFFAVYLPLALLALFSLYMAWSTDPGAVPLGARPLTIVRRAGAGTTGQQGTMTAVPSRGTRRCPKCNDNYKPARAHHDSMTNRCIVKFDHFCPWIGNAVGALNHKFFCLFLFYTSLTCIVALGLLLLQYLRCGLMVKEGIGRPSEETDSAIHYSPEGHFRLLDNINYVHKYEDCNHLYDYHLVYGLVIASVVFLIFTCSMGCEQLKAIKTGRGKIARMKISVGSAGTEYAKSTDEFNEMFGGDSPRVAWHWFFPFPVEFPRGMQKVVLGYDWDESFAAEPYQDDEGDQEMSNMESGSTLVPQQDGLTRSTSFESHSSNPSAEKGKGVKQRKAGSNGSVGSAEDLNLIDRTGSKLT